MTEFEDYIYRKISQEMRSWNAEEAQDVFLIRLYVGLVNDDLRQGTLSGPEYYTAKLLKGSEIPEDERWDAPAAHRSSFSLCEPIIES